MSNARHRAVAGLPWMRLVSPRDTAEQRRKIFAGVLWFNLGTLVNFLKADQLYVLLSLAADTFIAKPKRK